MPLIQSGDEGGSHDGDARPAQLPFHIFHRGQSCAPSAKQQDAKNAITDDVASFANVEMPAFEAESVDSEEKMQQGVEDAACVVGGKPCGRFDGDDDQP